MNISPSIQQKRKAKNHLNPKHPIYHLKNMIYQYFEGFEKFDELSEVVSIQNNFDSLLIPKTHPARGMSDTYYIDETRVLRTHTSAHQTELLNKKHKQFVVTGDVYRKDSIDATHYPVFTQMEGVKLLEDGVDALEDLKKTLSGLVEYLFPGQEYRFLDDYFPFTSPSIQIEVNSDGNWMEILGAGAIHPDILKNNDIKQNGWAFGLGLDRLVMHFCKINDIRYLWSTDERFIKQFENGLSIFEEYSKYPSTHRDISFWVENYQENHEQLWDKHNDFCELIREMGGDIIENVSVADKFTKGDKTSLLYRITYRSNDRTLHNDEINDIQNGIREIIESKFSVVLR